MCVLCSFFVMVHRISCLYALMNFVFLGPYLFRYCFCFILSQFSWDFHYIMVETLTMSPMTTAFLLIFSSFLHIKSQSSLFIILWPIFYFIIFFSTVSTILLTQPLTAYWAWSLSGLVLLLETCLSWDAAESLGCLLGLFPPWKM